MKIQSVALFASGTGSNALNLIRYFNDHDLIHITLLVCNKADAPVVAQAEALGLKVAILHNNTFEDGADVLQLLQANYIDWIVLAGFLRKLPPLLVGHYSGKIINIHPSLLPSYGGHGMYGMHVHRAVIAAKEPKSGITIHLVDEEFDNGDIVAQFETPVTPDDTPETLVEKVRLLEQEHFPYIVERTIKSHS